MRKLIILIFTVFIFSSCNMIHQSDLIGAWDAPGDNGWVQRLIFEDDSIFRIETWSGDNLLENKTGTYQMDNSIEGGEYYNIILLSLSDESIQLVPALKIYIMPGTNALILEGKKTTEYIRYEVESEEESDVEENIEQESENEEN